MTHLKYILFLLISVSSINVSAQAKFYAQGPSSGTLGKDYKVVFVIENADASNFKAPSFDGFQVLSGPNQSSSYQNINGKITNSVSLYYYLRPLAEGVLLIGKASVIIGGKPWYTDEIEVDIQVAKQAIVNQNGTQQNQNSPNHSVKPDDWKQQAKENLFVRLYTDQSKPYVGEQIFVYAKLYQRINTNGSQVTAYPEFKGFWKQEIEITNNEAQIEEYGGVQYQTFLVGKYALFPLKEGKHSIESVKMTSILLIPVPKEVNYWGMRLQTMKYEQVEYNYASNSLLIDVQALPLENKPSDFIGAVGNFKINTSIDSSEVKVSSPIHYKATISGVGNIMSIQEPTIDFPRQLEVYDPATNENISKKSNWVNGSKTYDYILVPQYPGRYHIPSLSFSYFDTKDDSYKTLKSGSFEISVKGEAPVLVVDQVEAKKGDSNPYELQDIYLSYEDLDDEGSFYTSWKYKFGLTSPFMLFFLFMIGLRMKEEFKPDLIALRNKRASQEAKRRLRKAKQFLDGQDQQAFYKEIFNAFNGYVGDKLNIEQADLNREFVLEKFKEKKISVHLGEQFNQVLNSAEEALYSPQSFGKMQEDYDTAITWIVNIENEIA
tara:strand:- start:2919 stop:4733 length:1815 start_codon:yes stop_codon:yes gene_type:complete